MRPASFKNDENRNTVPGISGIHAKISYWCKIIIYGIKASNDNL